MLNRRYKKLLSNTVIFSVSGFASKFLVFVMVPVYTLGLSTEEFGSIDLANTIIQFLVPLGSLQISSALTRFLLESSVGIKTKVSVGLFVEIIGSFFVILILGPISVVCGLTEHAHLISAVYLVYTFDDFWSGFSQGMKRVLLVGVCGVIKTFAVAVLGTVFLLCFNMGIEGYFLSYIIGFSISGVLYACGLRFWKYLSFEVLNRRTLKEMVKYSLPLVPNSLSWWVNSYASRIVIAAFSGTSYLGLFAVANRIPAMLNSIQMFLMQALNLTVLEEYDKGLKDSHLFFSKLYSLNAAFSSISASILIAFTMVIASLMFQGEFYGAWVYVPLLVVGTAVSAQSGYLGVFYTASKHTTGIFISTLIGCSVNLILCFILVPLISVQGACVAFLASQLLTLVIRLRAVRKIVNLSVSGVKSAVGYMLLTAQSVLLILFCESNIALCCWQVACLVLLAVLYKDEIVDVVSKVISSLISAVKNR